MKVFLVPVKRRIDLWLAVSSLMLSVPLWTIESMADTLAKWTFNDPSPSTTANYSPSTVAVGVSVTSITNGAGVTRHTTYNSASPNNAVCYIRHASSGVASWVPVVSGDVSGGAFLDFQMMPQNVNDLAEAISGDRYAQISITASGADVTITNIKMYAAQSQDTPGRCIDKGQWRVDTGSGYADWGAEMNFVTNTYRRESVSGTSIAIANGATVNLRLYGYMANNDGYGRTLAIDDLAILGTVDRPPAVDNPTDLSPTNNATVPPPSTLSATFSEAVTNGAGNIAITNLTDNTGASFAANDGQVSGLGTATITITPSPALANNKHYAILIQTNAFKDMAGQYFAGFTNTTTWNWNFHTSIPDTTPPTTNALSPADDATQVVATNKLVLTFTETVVAHSAGWVAVSNMTASTGTNVPANDAKVYVDGVTVSITGLTLSGSADYAVLVSTNAFKDAGGNFFAGITNTTGWNFRTDDIAPTVNVEGLSPADNMTNVSIGTSFVVTFSETVVAGSGNIILTNLTDGTGTLTIAVTDSSQVTVSGTTLTVAPTNYLGYGKSYAVRIASGAVRDVSGNAYAGISDTTTWNVTTSVEPSILAKWTFHDPSPATAADYSASTISPGVVVSVVTGGTGVVLHNAFNDTDRTTAISYMGHVTAGYGDPDPTWVPTASVGGGESGGAFLDFLMMPQDVNDLNEAITGNRYFQVEITAQRATLSISEIRLYIQQSTYGPERCIDKGRWRVDAGTGYANWGTEMSFATTRYELEQVVGAGIVVSNGATVRLRFYGYEANNDPYGRTLAIDDLTIMGTAVLALPGSIFRFR